MLQRGAKILIFFCIIAIVFLFSPNSFVRAVSGVPNMVSFQGRLLDGNGNLLGGAAGTNFCFRFSLYDDETPGVPDVKLWPSVVPSAMALPVRQGVFNALVGDTSSGSDPLVYTFGESQAVYLNIEVAPSNAGSCVGVTGFENLSPRQRIIASAFAMTSGAIMGSAQSSIGTTTPLTGVSLTVMAPTPTTTSQVIRSRSDQVADLLRLESASGTAMFAIDAGGHVVVSTTLTVASTSHFFGNAAFDGEINVGSLNSASVSTSQVLIQGGATTTNLSATLATLTSATLGSATSTNLATAHLTVGGQTVCLTNGLNCAATSNPTLQSVTNNGDVTTNSIQFAGGVSTGGFTVTGATTLATTTITNGTSTNFFATNLSGSNGVFVGLSSTNATISDLTASLAFLTSITSTNFSSSFANIANATSTNLAATLATLTSATLGSATSTNFFSTNLTTTNATSTNLFTTNLASTNATVTNVTSTNANITTLTGSTATLTSVTSTNGAFTTLTVTNPLNLTNLTWTNATGTNSILTNVTSTNLNVTGLTNLGNTTLTNGTSTNFNTTNLTGSTVTITSVTSTNLAATLATLTTATLGSVTSTNFFTTNLGVTNLTTINATSTNLSGQNLTFTNVTGTNGSITNIAAVNLTTTNFAATSASITNATLVGATSTNANITSLTGVTAVITSATTTNLNVSGLANLGNTIIANLSSTNQNSANYSGTNVSVTNATSTNLAATLATLTSVTLGSATSTNFFTSNLTYTNATGTNESLVNLTYTNATGTNERLTNLSLDNGTSTNFNSTNYSGTNVSVSNITTTNASVGGLTGSTGVLTSVTATNFAATLSSLTSLTVGSGSSTNFNTANFTYTNATGTNESLTNLVSLNVTSTNLFISGLTNLNNVVAGNVTTTNLNVSGLTNLGLTVISSATSTNFNATNFTYTNATGTNEKVTNLLATNATSTNLNVSGLTNLGNTIITNLTSTNASFTNVTATNVSSTNLNLSGTFSGAGLSSDCSAVDSKLVWNSTTKTFSCAEDLAGNTKIVSSTATVTLTGTQAALSTITTTPQNSSSEIWITANVRANNESLLVARTITLQLWRGATCAAPSVQVGINLVSYLAAGTATIDNLGGSFIDAPATTTAQPYTICGATDTGSPTVTNRSLSAQEINVGADLAEVYYSSEGQISPGEVIELDPSGEGVVRRTTAAYSPTALGIVATRPGLVLSNSIVGVGVPVTVALSGRVPVKVSTENGPIAPGDYLVPSSIPGVAMKAIKASNVLGQALTSYSQDGVGSVIVFIKNSYFAGVRSKSIFDKNTVTSSVDFSDSFLSRILAYGFNTSTLSLIRDSSHSIAETQITPNRISAQDILLTGGLSVSGTTQLGDMIARTIKADSLQSPEISSLASSTALLFASSTLFLEQLHSLGGDFLAQQDMLTALRQYIVSTTVKYSDLNLFGELMVSTSIRQPVIFWGGLQVDSIGSITSQTIFSGDVAFSGHTYFNEDTAGSAVITKGAQQVTVSFKRPYLNSPLVNAAIVFAANSSSPSSSTSDDPAISAQQIWDHDLRFVIQNKEPKGFTILLNKKAPFSIPFDWMAFVVQNQRVFFGAPSSEVLPEEKPVQLEVLPIVPTVIPDPLSFFTTSSDSASSSTFTNTTTPFEIIFSSSSPNFDPTTTSLDSLNASFSEQPILSSSTFLVSTTVRQDEVTSSFLSPASDALPSVVNANLAGSTVTP